MPRNKFPEKTVSHILKVSSKLFMEKGYEKTTIQDIINTLSISKGAIYHHFRSKEEILQAVIQQRNIYTRELLITLIHTTTAKNAKEKIIKILHATLLDSESHTIDHILISQIENSQFIVAGMQSSILEDSPLIATLFKEGVEDGSLSCESPTLCAEMFIFLINIWITPTIFSRTITETKERLYYLQTVLKNLGADIITDTLIQQIITGYQNIGAFNKK